VGHGPNYTHPGDSDLDGYDEPHDPIEVRRGRSALRRRRRWERVMVTFDGDQGWVWHVTIAWPVPGGDVAFEEHVVLVLARTLVEMVEEREED
jgi:hypothetical protein